RRGALTMVGLGSLRRAIVSFEEAVACVDAASSRLGTERVRPREAMGRVIAEDIRAAASVPPDDRAALDGFAVRADASLGASAYNPVELPLFASGVRLAFRHIGMLAAAEIDTVQVVRRPRVQILLAGPMATPRAPDSNGPMLRAAVERDGGVIAEVTTLP